MVEQKEYRVSDIKEEYEIRKIVIAEGLEFHENEIREEAERIKEKYSGKPEEKYVQKYYLQYLKPPLDYLREKIGDNFKIEENPGQSDDLISFESLRKVGRYCSKEQKVKFVIMTVVSKKDFKKALETEGTHVIYDGHSRYGRGACFAIYEGKVPEKYEQWERGITDDEGLFRCGYQYVLIPLEDIEKHSYTFSPVPVENGPLPSEKNHPFSRHPYARRKLSEISLPEDLSRRIFPKSSLSPSNRYYGLKREGKWHIILNAGWKDTINSPFDLGATELKCRVFCLFGCSSRLHFWNIVRRKEYKGWGRPKPPSDRYAYFTTAPSDSRLAPLWLYYLLTYDEKNNFKSWLDSLEYAKRETNKKLRSINAGYEVY